VSGSLRVISDHLKTTFNPLTSHNSVAGVAMATIMDATDNISWESLIGLVSHSKPTNQILQRWEFKPENNSILTDTEKLLVQEIQATFISQ